LEDSSQSAKQTVHTQPPNATDQLATAGALMLMVLKFHKPDEDQELDLSLTANMAEHHAKLKSKSLRLIIKTCPNVMLMVPTLQPNTLH
jgi:hypothetical protein